MAVILLRAEVGRRPAVAPAPRISSAEADLPNPQRQVAVRRLEENDLPLVLIEGGVAGTRRSVLRRDVAGFVRASGARAGLNGAFFANASLRGTDNRLIGPSLCGDETRVTFSPDDRKAALGGRPLVLLSARRTRILPYDAARMNTERDLRAALPGLRDAFLGGVWLVHNGVAAGPGRISGFHVQDAEDRRRRAFFFLEWDGRPGLGATEGVASSARLAGALQAAGIREAVLMDSGFSTSLVYGGATLVTGHTAPGIPSRPVPHALVLFDAGTPPTRLVNALSSPGRAFHPQRSSEMP